MEKNSPLRALRSESTVRQNYNAGSCLPLLVPSGLRGQLEAKGWNYLHRQVYSFVH